MIKQFYLFAFILVLLAACKQNEPASSKNESASTKKSDVLAVHPGASLYKKHCLACHQENGTGVPGMFPPLHGNPLLDKEPDQVLLTILYGKTGKVEVNGMVYAGMMAPFKHLPDEEILQLANYVQTRYGKGKDVFTLSDVKKARNNKGTK